MDRGIIGILQDCVFIRIALQTFDNVQKIHLKVVRWIITCMKTYLVNSILLFFLLNIYALMLKKYIITPIVMLLCTISCLFAWRVYYFVQFRLFLSLIRFLVVRLRSFFLLVNFLFNHVNLLGMHEFEIFYLFFVPFPFLLKLLHPHFILPFESLFLRNEKLNLFWHLLRVDNKLLIDLNQLFLLSLEILNDMIGLLLLVGNHCLEGMYFVFGLSNLLF